MTPIYFGPSDDIDKFTDTIVKAVLYFWAAIAAIVLALIMLIAIHAAWLRALAWCNAELSPVACSLYLAGI